jgi:hypothetical protein
MSLPASSLAAFSASTGEPIPDFHPEIVYKGSPGTVKAIATSPSGDVVYVGGEFTAVNGTRVHNLAAIWASGGGLVPSFHLPKVSQVNSILVNPVTGKLYVGGSFQSVDGKPRGNLASVFPDGTLGPDWKPMADDTVRKLRFSANGQTIFVAGHFSAVDGQPRQSVARLNLNGTLSAWAIPAGTIQGPMTAWDLAVTTTVLYVGFGQEANYAASFHLNHGEVGDLIWRKHMPGNVESVALSPSHARLFLGGHFGTAHRTQSCGSYALHGLASADPATGALDCSWLPHLYPDSHNFTGASTLLVDPVNSYLWTGGYFTQVCDESGATCVQQQSVARFGL